MATGDLIEDVEEQAKSEVTSNSDGNNDVPELYALVQMAQAFAHSENISAKESNTSESIQSYLQA